MANSPNTNSTLTFPNGDNRTSTSLSTHMILKVAGNPIGALQSLTISESRSISMIAEVGSDGFIDSTPTSSTQVSGSITRIRYDRMRLTEAMSRGYLHLAAQRYPFDIEIQDIQKEQPNNQIITIIKNVWFESLSYSLDANNWIISDSCNWKAEHIFSFRPGGTSAATGGDGKIKVYPHDAIEEAADLGKRRGSLDAPGLIDLVLEGSNSGF